jgi:hypothetical protein
MSLHHLHVPQAVMLECRLEILPRTSPQKILHVWICSPTNGGQYNDVLANDTYMVAVFRHDYLHDIWLVEFRQICIKPILSYILFKTKHFENLWMTLWNHTMVKSSMGFRIITWLHLPWVFEGWSNFKYIQKRWWDSSVHSLPRSSNCP